MMISKIDRYVRSTVIMAMFVVLLVLLGLDFVFTLFEEIGDTGDGYGSLDALRYVLLTMPRHIYELLPTTALIGSLAGLGVLASNNELMVMQASGISVRRIVWAVMKPALGVMVLGLILGQFVAPPLELRAEIGKALASGEETALSRYGSWQRSADQFMHFNAIDPDDRVLYGVSIYRYRDQQLSANLYAERAEYREDGRWELMQVNETEFQREGVAGVRSVNRSYPSLDWNIGLTPELLQVLIVDADRMAISDLFRYARFFDAQEQDASQYYLSFWKKVLQPLTTAVLVLVAISFIFGPLRDSTMGSKLFVAISFGLLFVILQNLINTVSLVYQLPPLGAVLLPIALSALIGGWLLRRAV